MRRRQCPKVLRKYGFCGVLALVYALNLKMPCTEAGFDALLGQMQEIIGGRPKKKWQRGNIPKNRGGITSSETRLVLDHYSVRCKYDELPVKASGISMTVNAWLKTVRKNTTYIVHLGKHAVFVDVPSVRKRLRIYDQRGAQNPTLDLKRLMCRGGLMLKKVHSVFTVTPLAADHK